MFDRGSAIRARLATPLLLALAIGVAWIAIESLVYRTGAYFFIAEPDSNTGAVVSTLLALDRHHRADARNVLVFGDSRVGEGFSALIAANGDAHFNFINLAVPGSSPRTWHYLLREIDRRGFAFDAVVVGVTYRPAGGSLHADWPLDPAHAARLLDLKDVLAFPATFDSKAMRDTARRTVLFPALASQQDAQAFLQAPWDRLHKVRRWRPAYLDAVRTYGGRDERMPEIGLAPAAAGVTNWGTATPVQRSQIETHLREVASQPDAFSAANADFMRRWISAMARITRDRQATLILYPLPRGPYGDAYDEPRLPAPPREFAVGGKVHVLAPDLLTGLEAPPYFFDALHVNGKGRERTSQRVGEHVRAILREDGPP